MIFATVAPISLLNRRKEAVVDYLTAQDAAERLMVTKRTIITWIKDGRFPGTIRKDPLAPRSPYLIPIKAIEKFEKERSNAAFYPENKNAQDNN